MYSKYKTLKNLLSTVYYNEISLGKMAGFFIANLIYKKFRTDDGSLVLNIYKYLFLIPCISNFSPKGNAIFAWSIERPDYRFLMEEYKKILNYNFDDICLGGQIVGRKFNFDSVAFLFAMKVALGTKNISIYDRFLILLAVHSSVSFYRYLDKNFSHNNKISACVTFNAAFAWESVFVLYMRKNNVKTYSLEHGVYFRYAIDPPYDVINYDNINSDIILVWSDFVANQIQPYLYSDTSIIVIGRPGNNIYSTLRHDINTKCILVALPRYAYIINILSLLKIFSQISSSAWTFEVKAHPSTNINELKKMAKSNGISLSNINFTAKEFMVPSYFAVISFNSSVLFEMAQGEIPVLQYICEKNEFYLESLNKINSFSDSIGLDLCISSIMKNEYTKSKIEYIKYLTQ